MDNEHKEFISLIRNIVYRNLGILHSQVSYFYMSTTEFDASKVLASGFQAPYSLGEGLARTLEFEFVHPRTDEVTFKTGVVNQKI